MADGDGDQPVDAEQSESLDAGHEEEAGVNESAEADAMDNSAELEANESAEAGEQEAANAEDGDPGESQDAGEAEETQNEGADDAAGEGAEEDGGGHAEEEQPAGDNDGENEGGNEGGNAMEGDSQQEEDPSEDRQSPSGGKGSEVNLNHLKTAEEQFLAEYQKACSQLGVEPIKVLVDDIVLAADSGDVMSTIELKGSSRSLFGRRLTDADANAIVYALEACPKIEIFEIDLSWNEIGDNGAVRLADFLRTDERIERLSLEYNHFGPAGATALAEALSDNPSVRELNLRGNKAGDTGGLDLATMLASNPHLTWVDLGNTDMGHRSLTVVGAMLSTNSTLEYLNIDRPALFSAQEESIEHLAMGLGRNAALRSLSLKAAGVRDRGCALLCDSLARGNRTLTELDLSGNKLTEDAGPALATLLQHTPCLNRLILANNQLCNRGCTSLSRALATNRTVTDLDVSHNKIENDGLIQLADAVRKQGLLQRFRVWGNLMEPQSAEALAYACQQVRSLEDSDMQVQVVDDVVLPVRTMTRDSYFFPGTV